MKLRKHQELARALAIECTDKVLTAHVTPGGGKTVLASVVAHEMLRAGEVAQVVVLCPRDSLRSQMADGFTVPALGLDGSVCIWDPRQSPRQGSMDRRLVGVVTTYQSAVVNEGRLLRLVKSAPTLLVLDEGHHLAGSEDGEDSDEEMAQWNASVQALAGAARRVLMMTGTIYRSDGQRIPFLSYAEDGTPQPHISYSRAKALDEEAVLPIEFRMWDGMAEYQFRGNAFEERLSTATEEASRALRTALLDTGDEGYAIRFLSNAMEEWAEYRRNEYRSKAIVVCMTQALARWAHGRLRDMGYSASLAISDERESARHVVAFRKRHEMEVLVTVGMAYEGLDVPEATHLVLLTNRRARPWLEQAVARVTRVNRACSLPVDRQFAYVYMPDDVQARKFVEEMREEQSGAVEERKKKTGTGVPRGPSTFKPGDAVATERNEFSERIGRPSDVEQRKIAEFRSHFAELSGVPAHELLAKIRRLELALVGVAR